MRSMTTLALVAGLLAAPAAIAQTSGSGTATPAQPGTTTPMAPAAPMAPGGTTPGGMGMGGAATPGTTTGTTSGTMTPGTTPGTTATTDTTRTEGPPTTTTPAAGANSFTEGQARSRIEAAGYTDVQGLAKDDQGVWRGKAMRNGAQADVGLDFRGNVVTGTGAAR